MGNHSSVVASETFHRAFLNHTKVEGNRYSVFRKVEKPPQEVNIACKLYNAAIDKPYAEQLADIVTILASASIDDLKVVMARDAPHRTFERHMNTRGQPVQGPEQKASEDFEDTARALVSGDYFRPFDRADSIRTSQHFAYQLDGREHLAFSYPAQYCEWIMRIMYMAGCAETYKLMLTRFRELTTETRSTLGLSKSYYDDLALAYCNIGMRRAEEETSPGQKYLTPWTHLAAWDDDGEHDQEMLYELRWQFERQFPGEDFIQTAISCFKLPVASDVEVALQKAIDSVVLSDDKPPPRWFF
jgi:hypothetical protein